MCFTFVSYVGTELGIPWLGIIVKHATLYSPVISHLHSNYPEHTGGVENKGRRYPNNAPLKTVSPKSPSTCFKNWEFFYQNKSAYEDQCFSL